MSHSQHPGGQFYLRRSAQLPFIEMRRADRSSACYRPHSHDEFSFGTVDRGCADYRYGNQHYTIGSGSLVTLNPGDLHSCNPTQQQWSYRMLFVDAAWIGQLQQETAPGAFDYRPFRAPLATADASSARFDQLFGLLERNASALQIETELIELLLPQFQAQVAPVAMSGPQPEILRVRELIMDNLEQSLSLETLCQTAQLNRYQLIRRFKQHYGQPPHAYQNDQRIKHAKQLLRSGKLPLASIAQRLGFADQAHFQRHFKQRLALTPGQYQAFFTS